MSYAPGHGVYSLQPDEIRAMEENLEQKLIEKALAQNIANSVDGLIVRDILPNTDLTLTNEVWVTAALTANAWNVGFLSNAGAGVNLNRTKLIGFTGLILISDVPAGTAVRFRQSTVYTKDIWVYEGVEALMNPQLYSKDPVIYDSQDIVMIDVYGRRAAVERIQLLGKVVEKRGVVIGAPTTA